MVIIKGFSKRLSVVIAALLSLVGASALAGDSKVDPSTVEIPVCRAVSTNPGQGESSGATPRAETRLDAAQLELLACLAKQEAAYRARGDQAHVAATRSRMRAVRQAACREFDRQKIACPISSHMTPPQISGCRIEGPSSLLPEPVTRVRIGMSKAELEAILGPADYSPAEGLYYFSTGGDCPLGETDREVSCGVVAEFRVEHANEAEEPVVSDKLQSCWWGGIGE